MENPCARPVLVLKTHISGTTIQICTEFKCVCDQFWVFMDNFEDIDQIN